MEDPGGQGAREVPFKPYRNVPRDRLDEAILSRMYEAKIAGVSAAFIKDGRVLWSGGYGWADLERERPAAPDTIYRIASVSKPITATALMQLWERGLFHLDDDIGEYLGYPVRNPRYPEVKITFRMLLTHTSSILDAGGYEQALAASQPPLLKDLLVPGGGAYTGSTWGDYRPGTRFNYSNFGAGIIGALVEVLSGEHFDRYARNHIFRPLGMDAGYAVADLTHLEKLAVLYKTTGNGRFSPACDYFREGEDPRRRPYLPLGNYYIGPAGAVRTSVLDLAKLMIAHMSGGVYQGVRLLRKDTADLMQQIHWYGFGLNGMFRQMGLFFHITDALAGRRLTGHPGEACGLVGDMYFDRDENTGIILMTNGGYYRTLISGFTDIEEEIINKIYHELAGPPGPGRRVITLRIGDNKAVVNGRAVFYPVPPEKKPADLYVPAVTLADVLQAFIEFDEKTGLLSLTKRGRVLHAGAGSACLETDNGRVPLETPVFCKEGYILWPFLTVARLFGAEVTYRSAEEIRVTLQDDLRGAGRG